MTLDLVQLSAAAVAAVGGLLVAWATTIPLLRYKEQRAKTRSDHRHRDDAATVVPAVAVLRHARCGACHRGCTAADVAPLAGWRRCRSCGAGRGR